MSWPTVGLSDNIGETRPATQRPATQKACNNIGLQQHWRDSGLQQHWRDKASNNIGLQQLTLACNNRPATIGLQQQACNNIGETRPATMRSL